MSAPPEWTVDEWERIDVLMSCGPRRPDWGKQGRPGPREMATMIHWRSLVLKGIPSLSHGTASAGGNGSAATSPPPQRKPKDMFAPGYTPVIRPPGVPDDNPRVRSGVYR